MADGAEDDDKLVREARQLPLPERLAHAHWRVRADAYADVGKEASAATDATSPTLAEFGAPEERASVALAFDRARAAAGVVAVKVVGDSNPNALDAGLDALTAFLQKADEEYASRCAPKPTQNPGARSSRSRASRQLCWLAGSQPGV